MKTILLASLAAASISVATIFPSTSADAAVHKNDGRWSIEVITDQGGCDRAYRYSVIVQNGQARYGGTEPFVVSGQIAPNGNVRGTIAYGEKQAAVVGKLADGWGKGTWTFRGGQTCSGHWNAERRG